MNGKGPGRSLRGTNSLLWALFNPSSRTVRRRVGKDRAAERDAAAAVQRRGHLKA